MDLGPIIAERKAAKAEFGDNWTDRPVSLLRARVLLQKLITVNFERTIC